MAAVGDVRCKLLIVGAGLLWEQEAGSSNLPAPTLTFSNLGGSKRPAFFYVHTNVRTAKGLSLLQAPAPLDLSSCSWRGSSSKRQPSDTNPAHLI